MAVVVRFSKPVQTGSGVHLASCTMGTVSFFPGAKRPGRGVDHPPAMPLPEHFRLLRQSFAARREEITIKNSR